MPFDIRAFSCEFNLFQRLTWKTLLVYLVDQSIMDG